MTFLQMEVAVTILSARTRCRANDAHAGMSSRTTSSRAMQTAPAPTRRPGASCDRRCVDWSRTSLRRLHIVQQYVDLPVLCGDMSMQSRERIIHPRISKQGDMHRPAGHAHRELVDRLAIIDAGTQYVSCGRDGTAKCDRLHLSTR